MNNFKNKNKNTKDEFKEELKQEIKQELKQELKQEFDAYGLPKRKPDNLVDWLLMEHFDGTILGMVIIAAIAYYFMWIH